ncbi:MAG TPA: TonB family protein [Rhodocyclaceae bacterium]|jgi:TonB family protein|nr:TonB family protein [Rhodocyclaceae bacterium]
MTPVARLSLALVVSAVLHLALLAKGTVAPASQQRLNVTLVQPPPRALTPDTADPSILDKNTIATAEKAPQPPKPAANPRPSRMRAAQEAQALRKLSQYVLYPPEAISANHEGTVHLLLKCDADGNILSVNVAAGSGYPELDDAAVRAAMHAGRIATGGKSNVIIPITFQLQ